MDATCQGVEAVECSYAIGGKMEVPCHGGGWTFPSRAAQLMREAVTFCADTHGMATDTPSWRATNVASSMLSHVGGIYAPGESRHFCTIRRMSFT